MIFWGFWLTSLRKPDESKNEQKGPKRETKWNPKGRTASQAKAQPATTSGTYNTTSLAQKKVGGSVSP